MESISIFHIMLRGLHYWQKNQPKGQAILLYGGMANEIINENMSVASWTEIMNL